MTDEPTPGELRRLYEVLREDTRRGFESVNSRLDKMPTSELLMAHLSAWQQQLETVRDDQATMRAHIDQEDAKLRAHVNTEVAELRGDLDTERRDRTKQHDDDVNARRWAIGVVAIPIILSLLAIAAATGVIG